MRQPAAAFTVAAICVLAAACGTEGSAESMTSTKSMIPRPLVERELSELLLTPEQLNAAMGATELAVVSAQTSLTDHSAIMSPRECLAIDGAAEAVVYADSDYWAARDQSLNDGDDFAHYVKQAVVLFPTMEKAGEFFDASVNQWPACSKYTHTQTGSRWHVGEITNSNGILSTVSTQQQARAPGWGCGRAVAHRNNIIIDVNTCSADPADSAVKIADEIGANVNARW